MTAHGAVELTERAAEHCIVRYLYSHAFIPLSFIARLPHVVVITNPIAPIPRNSLCSIYVYEHHMNLILHL